MIESHDVVLNCNYKRRCFNKKTIPSSSWKDSEKKKFQVPPKIGDEPPLSPTKMADPANEKSASESPPSTPPKAIDSLPISNSPEEQPSQSKNERIKAFIEAIAGTTPDDAVAYLNRFNWNIQRAVGCFMDERRPTPSQRKSNPQGSSQVYRPANAQPSEMIEDILSRLPSPSQFHASVGYYPGQDYSNSQETSPSNAQGYLKGFSGDETSEMMLSKLPSPSQFHASVGSKGIKIGSSSSSSMEVDPTESLKESGGEEHIPEAMPLMASSQVKESRSPGQTPSPPMDIWVDLICDDSGVSREEALFYLELFNWNLGAGMEACRTKTLPLVKETSVCEESAEPVPMVIDSRGTSNQLPSSREQLSQLNDKLIVSFLGFVGGATREEATACLKLCNWDINQAINYFFDQASHVEFRGNQGYLKEGQIGSSSSSVNADPTETGRPFKEAGEENVTVPVPGIATSQVVKNWKREAVDEDSSTETGPDPLAIQDRIIVGPRAGPITTAITFQVVLADGGNGAEVDMTFRSDQTLRDIRNTIAEFRPDDNRNYYLTSVDGEIYDDLNTTVQRISSRGSTVLIQVFSDS